MSKSSNKSAVQKLSEWKARNMHREMEAVLRPPQTTTTTTTAAAAPLIQPQHQQQQQSTSSKQSSSSSSSKQQQQQQQPKKNDKKVFYQTLFNVGVSFGLFVVCGQALKSSNEKHQAKKDMKIAQIELEKNRALIRSIFTTTTNSNMSDDDDDDDENAGATPANSTLHPVAIKCVEVMKKRLSDEEKEETNKYTRRTGGDGDSWWTLNGLLGGSTNTNGSIRTSSSTPRYNDNNNSNNNNDNDLDKELIDIVLKTIQMELDQIIGTAALTEKERDRRQFLKENINTSTTTSTSNTTASLPFSEEEDDFLLKQQQQQFDGDQEDNNNNDDVVVVHKKRIFSM